MADLLFDAELDWSGTGKKGEGKLTIGNEVFTYSGPENMGGKGVGVSPEDLLIGAVSTCYSSTLFALLVKKGLPAQTVEVKVEGTVTGYPLTSKFSKLIVHPTIDGADLTQQEAYKELAVTARKKCFIGKTIEGNVDYSVGIVSLR